MIVLYTWFYTWFLRRFIRGFDTYTLKSHIPQKEDKGSLTNTKICILKQNILLVILCDEHMVICSYGPFNPQLLL